MIINKFNDKSNIVYNFRVSFCEKYSSDNPDVKDKDVIKFSKIAANIKFRNVDMMHLYLIKLKIYINLITFLKHVRIKLYKYYSHSYFQNLL